jgi:hypothetical protein
MCGLWNYQTTRVCNFDWIPTSLRWLHFTILRAAVWQCDEWCQRQCVAVRGSVQQCSWYVVYGSVHGSVRLSGSAAVCSSVRRCAAVCGSAAVFVWQKCGSGRLPSSRGRVRLCVAVCGSALYEYYIKSLFIIGAGGMSPIFLASLQFDSRLLPKVFWSSTVAGLFFEKSTFVGWKSWKSTARSTFETIIDSMVNFWNHSRQYGQLSREKSTVAGSRICHVVDCWLWRIFFEILRPFRTKFCTNSVILRPLAHWNRWGKIHEKSTVDRLQQLRFFFK